MQTFVVELKNQGVTLTGYLHGESSELSNVKNRPAVLILPGGAYATCSDREAEPVALAYMAEGYHAFVLRYSVGKNGVFPTVLEDAEEALQIISENAKEWNIIKEKIAAVGFSAGGHLAACLGTMGKNRPSAVILGYPAIGADTGKALGKELPGADEEVDEKTPPAFVFTTQEDEVVSPRNSLTFVMALQKAGIPYELHIFRKGSHGLSLAKAITSGGSSNMVNTAVQEWFPMSINFLKGIWGEFELREYMTWGDDKYQSEWMGIPLSVLLNNHLALVCMEKHIPDVLKQMRKNEILLNMSLNRIAKHASGMLGEEVMKKLDEEFCVIERDNR